MIVFLRLAAGYHWLQRMVAAVAGFDQVMRSQTTVQTHMAIEQIVMTVMAAELAGASLAPADLAFRLLPFCVPHVYRWRRATPGSTDVTAGLNMGC
jgi:hypothetical protein